MEDFRARETPMSPQSSSGLTGDASSEFVETKEPFSLDNPVTESMSTEWTNEKHSLYLKSMEASFVNQLYASMDLLGFCRSQKEKLSDAKNSRQKHFNTRTPSGQFKVLRSGCWQKINFERAHIELRNADESGGLLANPWIQHFKSSSTDQVVASPAVQDNAASTSQALDLSGNKAMSSKQFHACHSHLCHHELVGSNTEVSDQNFVDEEVGEKASPICNTKRMKSCTATASSNDQVVPHKKSPTTEDVPKSCFPAA